ncbi:hypothetical protein BGZ60DRAFT_485666 [Tricladium varicosporioides]|nr:hypothetical protein BGZ60DRAFT_485666 [Hymenoscyphus varicosporioides]
MDAFFKLLGYLKTHTQEGLYVKKSPYAYAPGLEGLTYCRNTYYEAISHYPKRLSMFIMTMMQIEQTVPILGVFPFSNLKDKDAHVYFLQRTLHGFYSPVYIQILRNIASAIGSSSCLIITDMVMPEKTEVGSELTPYWIDFSMMMLNRKEMLKKEFKEILEAASLEIVEI